MAKTRKIFKKVVQWLLAVILILIVTFFVAFLVWGKSFTERKFSSFITKESNGQYEASFSNIGINPFTRSLTLYDLDVRSTSSDSLHFKFHFSAKTFRIEKIRLFRYLNRKDLHLGALKLTDPLIQVGKKPDVKNDHESIRELVDNLHPYLRDYLHSLSIDKIELNNAGFLNKTPSSQLLSTAKAINFNVGITQFYTDSLLLQTADYFDAEDVYLGIDNYQKTLSDSTHILKVEQLTYSIKNKGIKASKVDLTPIDSTITGQTLYWVKLPELQISSKDINNILREDTVRIDSLQLMGADIRVMPPENKPGINFKEIKDYDLYQLVSGEFKQLHIGFLSMEANMLRIQRKKEQEINEQNFTDLKVVLHDFQLDSMSYSDPERVLYSDQLSIQVDKYSLELNDQIHQFTAKNIHADSENNTIGADQLKMWSTAEETRFTKISLTCDSIRMHNVDMKRLYHLREMPLQQLAAYKPVIQIDKGERKKIRSHESNSLLYDFISNYIKGVYSNLITIEDGKFKITSVENRRDSTIIETNFAFRLTDFSLDSISANKTDKLFFATNIELEFDHYHMKLQDQLHFLDMEKIEVSSIQKSASIRNLHLFPAKSGDGLALLEKYNRSGLYNIKIPLLQLRNTNVHHAFFNKKLNINYFSIIQPSIEFELRAKEKENRSEFDFDDFYNLIKSYISDVRIYRLKIPNGRFQLVNHDRRGKTISFDNSFNLELEGFRFNDAELNNDRLLFSDNFELTLKDHLFRLSDKVHYLQLKEIGFSTKRNEVFVKNAILYPDITSPEYPNLARHLQINIPDFTFQGVDIKRAYFDRELVVQKLTINKPEIKIYQTGKATHKIYLKDFTLPLPEEIKLLSLKDLSLKNGHISLLKTQNGQHREIASLDIDLEGKNASLTNQGENQPATFHAEDINSTAQNLKLIPDLGNYNFSIAKINFSQSSNKIQLHHFDVSLKKELPKSGFTGGSIRSMEIDGLETPNDNGRNIIRSNTILAEGAELNFARGNNRHKRPNLYQLKLNEDLLTLMDEFSSNSIRIKDANLNLEGRRKSRHFKNINLKLDNFRLTENSSGNLLGAETLDISLEKLQDSDKNKWYNLSCNEFHYTSDHSTLSFRGVRIEPNYSKNEFQQVIPFQTDYYQGGVGLIKIKDFDLNAYLETRELRGNEIRFEDAKMNIYRDMRKPFNEQQRPPMPQDLIRNYKQPFYFDSVKIVNSTINYSEQLEKMPEPGTIQFQQINASLYPFTNEQEMLLKAPTVNLKASTLLFGEAKLETQMQFNMLSAENDFQVTGSIAPFEMSALNPMTKNAALVTIRTGDLNRFEFDFKANNTVANGKLEFAYDNLKVNILSLKDGDTKESKFASFLANSLVIKSKNPRSRVLTPDPIYFERDQKRSILNYWWKSIFSGVKNTFGIKDEEK